MLAAAGSQAPWPFREISLDPNQMRGVAWLTLLMIGAIVALSVGPGRIVAKVWVIVYRHVIRKFVRACIKAGLEIAAWLGYEGKRLLFFLAWVGLILLSAWLFGRGVGIKFLILGLFIAWTSPHRRRMRQRRQLRGIDTKLDRLDATIDARAGAILKALGTRARQLTGTSRPVPQPQPTPRPAPAHPYNWQQPPHGAKSVFAPTPPPAAAPAPVATAGAARRRRGGGFRGPGSRP